MIRGLLNSLADRIRPDEDVVDEEEDGIRFIPSGLDASVRYAHGGDDAGERELVKVQEEAQQLEEQEQEKN
ncbi:hypothetical protein [Halorubrum sp. F4]|uniref:hypothetical protein n=1 Tax=Halorubrum sp. F4 TaxID=2989715 RepID=UPI00247FBB92|nr:hypothetical protein [Halorubrum sp. F4]